MEVHGKTRTFTYDANGNMLSDGKYTYSWTKGNLLEKVTGDGLEVFFVKHFSLKKASEFPVFSEGFFLL